MTYPNRWDADRDVGVDQQNIVAVVVVNVLVVDHTVVGFAGGVPVVLVNREGVAHIALHAQGAGAAFHDVDLVAVEDEVVAHTQWVGAHVDHFKVAQRGHVGHGQIGQALGDDQGVDACTCVDRASRVVHVDGVIATGTGNGCAAAEGGGHRGCRSTVPVVDRGGGV